MHDCMSLLHICVKECATFSVTIEASACSHVVLTKNLIGCFKCSKFSAPFQILMNVQVSPAKMAASVWME